MPIQVDSNITIEKNKDHHPLPWLWLLDWKIDISNLPRGLIGWWKLDENAANTKVKDFSGYGNHGNTVGGNTSVLTTKGIADGAFILNGTTQYITWSDAESADYKFTTGDFSVGIWFNTTNTDGYSYSESGLITRKNTTYQYSGGWCLTAPSGRVWFTMGDGSNYWEIDSSPNNYNDGKWHFAFISVRRGIVSNLYVDGKLVASDNTESLGSIDSTIGMLIGKTPGTAHEFDGSVDDAMIFNRALSEAEQNRIYQIGLEQWRFNCYNLQGWWKCDEANNNNVVNDSSGKGNTGTSVNGTTGSMSVAGKIDRAFELSSSKYVNTNSTFHSVFQGSFAVSIWIEPDDGQPSSEETVWGVQLAGTDVAKLYLRTDGRLSFNFIADSNGLTFNTVNPIFSDGPPAEPVNVVCVGDAVINGPGGLKLYINGDLDNSASSAGITFANFLTNLDLFIGGNNLNGGLNSPFNGSIDDVMIFGEAITHNMIKQLYNLKRPGEITQTLHLVNNQKSIDYQGVTYQPCNFDLGPWEDSMDGELPQRGLSVSNADLVKSLHPYVRDYQGAIDSQIIITPVHAGLLSVDMSNKAVQYTVMQTGVQESNIIFMLGASNPLLQACPGAKYFADHCWYVRWFPQAPCNYSGSDKTCNGTFLDCYTKGNSANGGFFIGLRSKLVRFA
jgi:phage-related protein